MIPQGIRSNITSSSVEGPPLHLGCRAARRIIRKIMSVQSEMCSLRSASRCYISHRRPFCTTFRVPWTKSIDSDDVFSSLTALIHDAAAHQAVSGTEFASRKDVVHRIGPLVDNDGMPKGTLRDSALALGSCKTVGVLTGFPCNLGM